MHETAKQQIDSEHAPNVAQQHDDDDDDDDDARKRLMIEQRVHLGPKIQQKKIINNYPGRRSHRHDRAYPQYAYSAAQLLRIRFYALYNFV